MHAKGNLRLLLNANLWKEMAVTPMDGGKGASYSCCNHALGPVEDKKEGDADKKEAEV